MLSIITGLARLRNVCAWVLACSAAIVAAGCDKCRHSGAGGRTLLSELVETDLELFRTYRKNGKAEARAQWLHGGGISKTRHLIQRVEEGLIDPLHAEAAVGLLDHDARTTARAGDTHD